MWWLDPGKEVLNLLFNRILAPYVENLDMNQVNYGIGQGQLTLRGLRLKKGALDKFRLPIDVLEGHLGTFTLSLHWMNLGNQPVEIIVEDVYLLVVPSTQTKYDPEEDAQRAYAAKMDRVANAEILNLKGTPETAVEEPQPMGLWESMTAKIINNLQVTVKNIHVRYEDKYSVPGHPFAVGLTLAGFTAVSVNEEWMPSFIESTAGAIHKLANLESLAVYFDTESPSMAGMPLADSIKKFKSLIAHDDQDASHQFILKPVSGEGRVIMNHKISKDVPRFDVQLLFNEIGVVLNDNQYRDAIMLMDMLHVYTRQHQYRKYRPSELEYTNNVALARLRFAGTAILEGVRARNYKRTWPYIAERRDDRKSYVPLYQKKLLNTLSATESKEFEALEKKLSYEDIRFYRSLTRRRLREDKELQKRLKAEKVKQQQPAKKGWGAWIWGSSPDSTQTEEPSFTGDMTEEQRKELYRVIEYDEQMAKQETSQTPTDSMKARVVAKLNKGSFALRVDPHGKNAEIILVQADVFQAYVIQREDNLGASISLNGFSVFDHTTEGSLHSKIVQVKLDKGNGDVEDSPALTVQNKDDPFLFVQFEHHPLDGRADNVLVVRMRHMEIVYHKGYAEAIYNFFKPPESQLESVEALLSAASESLEGLSKETRAGLEFALSKHKTIDIQLDMHAPVIIIPADVSSHEGIHLIVDAGHIAIESQLVDKAVLGDINRKRGQSYGNEDYAKLESLMYDKYILKLKNGQFIIGNGLQSCREALTSNASDSLHLVERITEIDLQVQNSIVPQVTKLARRKVSGNLPTLQVNLSDTKYKSLMHLIDVCIPKLGDDSPPPPVSSTRHANFPLFPGLFSHEDTAYHVDYATDDEEDPDTSKESEEFFEANEGLPEEHQFHQHQLEIDFKVDELRASISKSSGNGVEKPLGDVSLKRFALMFVNKQYDMKVDVNLRSLSMSLVQPGADRIQFMSSAESGQSEDRDLLNVTFVRAERESPEFDTIFDGVEQSVDVKISTFIFRAAPEPVVMLYDFIMTTFVPKSNPQVIEGNVKKPLVLTEAEHSDSTAEEKPTVENATTANEGKIRVAVRLASVQVVLMNGDLSLATLSLSTADVGVLLRPKTLQVTGRLGNLALSNDSLSYVVREEFKQIVSIEGQNFAEFRYQTFDPEEEGYAGVKSSVYLNAASIKLHFLEEPLQDIYLFLVKLAKLKGLYDAATQVAVQRASEIEVELLQFEVSVKTPIVVFPSDPERSPDVLVLRLGEITARNTPEAVVNKIAASLRGIQLVSNLYYSDKLSSLKIIDDIEITADIVQTSGIDRSQDTNYPDTQIAIKISDVRLHLTQIQYVLLLRLSQSIPRVFTGTPDTAVQAESSTVPSASSSAVSDGGKKDTQVDLEPELRAIPSGGSRSWTTIDLVVTINVVKLHLYDSLAISESSVKEHGIARFALTDNTLRLKLLSDGAGEAQIILKSFTMGNTRPGNSRFREIIPAAKHDRNQFMVLYTMSGGTNGSALAIVTVDSPQIIFAVDPVFSLLKFFTSAFPTQPPVEELEYSTTTEVVAKQPQTSQSLDFRIDLHDVSISVLESDADPDSQSIKLTIHQISISQQGIMALTITRLGMSLMRMGRNSDTVRFLDDFDLTFSLDSRSSSSQQMTSMEVSSKPIVFRASYRDINLISAIVQRALELYNDSQNAPDSGRPTLQTNNSSERRITKSHASKTGTQSQPHPVGSAGILTSKEQLKGSFDGFRLVLIGDMHEQPMLHLKVKPFIIGAKDWSGELNATTTMATHISYWNLTNSHWEPLIDPWTFTIAVMKTDVSSGYNVKLSSRERLDLNLSTTFAELAITSLNMWGKEGDHVLQKARGSYAPYRIRNRTGSAIFVWSDLDGSSSSKDRTGLKILNDQAVDWRFDDWKTMREHVSSSGQQNIGIQFIGKSWEQLRSIPVDREGEFVFSLRPRTEKFSSRLLCEVTVVDNVKVVTIRSTYKVENQTLYPLELTLVDDNGHPVYSLEKIAPGQDYSLPIEAVMRNRIRIQPDQGFGYKWCPAIRWEDLVAKKGFTIKCPHTDPKEASFRFQAWAQTDLSSNDSAARKQPKIHLKLRAPLELENLLPYNLQYRVYDKDTDQNWRSYLRKGGIMPVHSVELAHLVLLNIEVQDTVFKPSDFAIINTDGNSDFDIENSLTVRDAQDRKLDLKLNYIRYPDSGGAFKVQIYSPYLVVNKTGVPFNIKSTRSTRTGSPQDVAGDSRPDILSQPIPFMLSHPSAHGHEFALKLGDSALSKVFSLEAPAAETTVVIPSQKQKSDEIHVGLSWTEGLGKYKLTKVITLTPRFLIRNNLREAITFRQHGVAPRERSVIEAGERCPLLYVRVGQENLLTVALPGLNAQWSPPINIEDIGSVHFRLRSPGKNQESNVQLIRADIKIDGSTIFISLSTATDDWPFLIENDSKYTVTLSQKDATHDDQSPPGRPASAVYTIAPRSSIPYAWDYPAPRDKKILLTINGSKRTVDIMEIGDLVPFKFKDGRSTETVALDVRADGQKQVLRITEYDPEFSLYKPKARSNSVSTLRQDSISTNGEAFEVVTEEVVPTLGFSIEFAGLGISLVNRKLVEVIYVSMDTLAFDYTDSTVAQTVTVSCGTLQIDNQLHDALYPVILQPTPIPKDSRGIGALPTVQGSVIWLKDQEHGVLFVKYCSILLQALTIEADEDLLFSIYDLTQIKGASWEDEKEDVLILHAEDIPEPQDTPVGQDVYFEVLELQPIKLSLSFMRTERVSSEEKLSLRNPLAVVLNAFTMTVGNINDAPLEMNALAIKDMRLTIPELQSRITYHYRQDVLRQLYRILGSADFIGNPVGLFTNVSSGVADIFYEPFNGVVMHGNKELGIGIAKGAASFVKKTVFGLSDSVTKLTSSVGKGLSAATFDSEYQARRRMTQRRNRPRHAIYGFTAGGEALASSMASAMEGVLIKPIEGAESEGAFGFFKGVGKGIVGAVTKPVVGVLDLASNVSEGIRNTTTVFDNPDRERVRLPRVVPADGVLRPYASREAMGQYWMRDLNNGVYRKEAYVAHINTPGSDNVVLLTASRVISFWSKKLKLEWDLPFTQIQGVTVEDTGIRFGHKAGKEHDKFVFIPEKSSQSWFFDRVAGVVKSFNIQRRMDG